MAFGAGSSFVMRAVPCIAGWLVAFLVTTPEMPVAPLPNLY